MREILVSVPSSAPKPIQCSTFEVQSSKFEAFKEFGFDSNDCFFTFATNESVVPEFTEQSAYCLDRR